MTATRLSLVHPNLAHTMERLPAAALLCATGLLLGVVLAGTQALDASRATTRRSSLAEPPAALLAAKAPQRAREGAEIIDQLGSFRVTGDRIAFTTADGRQRYVALENLNLERVSRAIAESPDPLRWSVSGMLTEYRGTNFLLISRVVAKGSEDKAAAR